MKVLFIEPYPTEGASSRYRVEQYIPYLEKGGIECAVRPFVSSQFYKILYKDGFYFLKTLFFIQSTVKRLLDIFTAAGSDIVFIHLEAFPFGPPLFELLMAKLGKKIIYDLDDAIYMRRSSPANKFLKYLKYPSKIKKIIKISDYVIACNEYLANYARKYNQKVAVIHTSVDTSKFVPKRQRTNQEITIGWIGSHSTVQYLETLTGVFQKLGSRHSFNLKIIGADREVVKIPGVNVINMKWCLSEEIRQFQSLDIGIYPLSKDDWVKGKTGFKAIQYMSIGVPCVASGIGANLEIIRDGINGFLASNEDEWVQKLSNLIESEGLRRKIGLEGRKTAEERFSVKVNAPKYMEIIKYVCKIS